MAQLHAIASSSSPKLQFNHLSKRGSYLGWGNVGCAKNVSFSKEVGGFLPQLFVNRTQSYKTRAVQAVLASDKETEVSGATQTRGLRGKLNKVFLAYSGGLDTSVIVPWLRYQNVKSSRSLRLRTRCASADDAGGSGKWLNWLPKGAVEADKVLRLIAGATSSPICQFISTPTTFLHSIDPRVKLVWLLVLVVLPARSHVVMRFGLVACLALLSIWVLPKDVWKDQLGRVALISGILFLMLGLGADSVPSSIVQSRTPPPAMLGLPNFPASLGGYSYVVLKLGPLELTRKGLSVASTSACLSFTIFQSASLCLTTTTPEQLAAALRWFMLPLVKFGVPVAEIILTLMLSLRFINIVFDEVRNVALGIVSRRIYWQQLTTMETIGIFFTYIRRIFKNIFAHAEQISQAMIVRGFKGNSNNYTIYFLTKSTIETADIVSLLSLAGLVAAAVLSGYILI